MSDVKLSQRYYKAKELYRKYHGDDCEIIVAFDLDGVLAEFDLDKWTNDKSYIGKPIRSMIDLALAYQEDGAKIYIFTARGDISSYTGNITKWCNENGLYGIKITNKKLFNMILIYDDRASFVLPNTGIVYEDYVNDMVNKINYFFNRLNNNMNGMTNMISTRGGIKSKYSSFLKHLSLALSKLNKFRELRDNNIAI